MIEVLAAILVATIGVAGVMVIIPFAVGQAEQGFDQEIATSLGRNFADEFELRGYHRPETWAAPPAPYSVPSNSARARGFVVDPIGTMAVPETTVFPYVSDSILTLANVDSTIGIARTGLWRNPDAVPASREALPFNAAKLLFSWRHDLVFGQPTLASVAATSYATPELAPAEMLFDVDGSNRMRRQFNGEFSCVVFCLPDAVSTTSGQPYVRNWRSQTVVYRRRILPSAAPTTSGQPSRPYDRVYDVTNVSPDRSLVGGGELLLSNIEFATSNSQSTQHSDIRRGDWIALTNITDASLGTQQLSFYQVNDAALEDPGNPTTSPWRVTLQGPNFDLLPWTGKTAPVPEKTFAIHLPDVWAVIERSYEFPAE